MRLNDLCPDSHLKVRKTDGSFDVKNQTWFLCLLIICVSAAWSRYIFMPTTDVAWLTLAARRLLDGQKFGSGIYEFNTPFAILFYAPSVLIGHFFHLSSFLVTYTITTLIVLFCVQLSAKILLFRAYPSFQNIININLFKIAFLSAYLFIPNLNGFAQRDHIIAVLLLPYFLIKLSPAGFKEHSDEPKYFINMMAALLLSVACLIKPHYIIYVLFVNIFSILYLKETRFFRLGIFFNLLVILLFRYSVVLLFPEWLKIIRVAAVTYSGYRVKITDLVFYCVNNFYIPCGFLFLLNSAIKKDESYILRTIFIISISAIVFFLIFGNKWYYHILPMVLPLWGMVAYYALRIVSIKKYYSIYVLICMMIGANNFFLWKNSNNYYSMPLPQEVYTHMKSGDTFMCISPDIQCAFPLVMEKGYNYVSRYHELWPTTGAKNLYFQGRLGRETFIYYLNNDINNLLEDIYQASPKMIVIEWWGNNNDAEIQDFSANPSFMKMLGSYWLLKKQAEGRNFFIWVYMKKGLSL